MDFGWNVPSAFELIGFYDDEAYVLGEVYAPELTKEDLIEEINQVLGRYQLDYDDLDGVYCDSASPDRIEALARYGLPCYPSVKDVKAKINTAQETKIHIHERCVNLIREMPQYEWKRNKDGIVGVVADIIQVNQEYEIAVETALGGSIQNIVTDNENTAKRLIQFLKKNRFGRATFLPLTTIGGKYSEFSNKDALKEPGVIGLAKDLVKVHDKYSAVTNHLLGRILVVDTIDHAIAVNKKYNQSLRIVTKEGELLTPGGAMTGGAFKNSSNLLGRKRELDELTKELTEINEEIETVDKPINIRVHYGWYDLVGYCYLDPEFTVEYDN